MGRDLYPSKREYKRGYDAGYSKGHSTGYWNGYRVGQSKGPIPRGPEDRFWITLFVVAALIVEFVALLRILAS